jgi:putative Mg2+ transporter-C (MgtC) family protein
MDLVLFGQDAGCALVFGFLIGIERQIRNSAAGLRTNTLVATGAAIFVLIETLTGAKDSRVAAQIVSGIGFIGGGAILRDGFTIRGVNTAATLWCSAAVGALCGSGMIAEGALATAIILFANVALRPLSYRLAGRMKLRSDVETHYLLQFTCKAMDESRVRQAVAVAAKNASLMTQSIRSEELPQGGVISIKVMLISATKADHALEQVVETLSPDASVCTIEWEVAAQPGAQHE